MRDSHKHGWVLSTQEAIQIQRELSTRVVFEPIRENILRLIAGVDVGLPRTGRTEGATMARAAIAVLDYSTMELVEHAQAESPVSFPYIPGLLSFREMPVILAALEQLETKPDVFMIDGHGYAHPRRFGLACHLGVWLDKPAIGCGKSILSGEHAPLGNLRGSIAPLQDGDETIGAAVRTRDKVKPVYVSVGHRVDLMTSIRITLGCGRGLRLPEPIRWAHRLASS
jgi:deoxyribonuclease V